MFGSDLTEPCTGKEGSRGEEEGKQFVSKYPSTALSKRDGWRWSIGHFARHHNQVVDKLEEVEQRRRS